MTFGSIDKLLEMAVLHEAVFPPKPAAFLVAAAGAGTSSVRQVFCKPAQMKKEKNVAAGFSLR